MVPLLLEAWLDPLKLYKLLLTALKLLVSVGWNLDIPKLLVPVEWILDTLKLLVPVE